MAAFRYLVNDVEKSIAFYTESLGFRLERKFGPAMAIVSKDDLTLWLAGPLSSAAQPMPDGRKPEPGGWNRLVLQVENLIDLVGVLKRNNVHFRNEIVKGPGGSQILCEDPSGNAIELFQERAAEVDLSQLQRNVDLAPNDRLSEHQNSLDLVFELERAGERLREKS
jgi:catechol 2,3-dioxygenase-like lactoylglutathione lyase family enzyme